MAYSKEALRLRTLAIAKLPRVSDRLSFLAIDRARIVQGRTGVVAVNEDSKEVPIAAAGLMVLMLGPGCSITIPAWQSLANSGCVIVASNAAGDACYSSATPLTASGQWACAQATAWAVPENRIKVARSLYQARFPEPLPTDLSFDQLRGIEGARMKAIYKTEAAKVGLDHWRRRIEDDEGSVNSCLNLGNSILYGLAAGVCAAFGLSPSLGMIHQGAVNAFLFDLADVYKTETSIPAAFSCRREEDPLAHMRRTLRGTIHRKRILKRMTKLVVDTFTEYLPKTLDADVLYSGRSQPVQGHVNYGATEDAPDTDFALGTPDGEPF